QLATGAGEGRSFDFDLADFASTYQLDTITVHHCLKVLAQSGWLSVSDAVYLPASLQIRVNKDRLYDYQLKNAKLDRILKVILRSYEGAFNHPVKLREKQLAQFLKIPSRELRQALHRMHQDSIIRYAPPKEKPQLTFLRERVPNELLSIDLVAYRARQERAAQRLKAAVRYVETERCRSRLLVEYFGETTSQDCGQCDVCLALQKNQLSRQQYQQLRDAIRARLTQSPSDIKTLVNAFGPKQEKRVLVALRYLLDEGFVEQEGQVLVWKG
ncbi:MAG: RecQ family zinc-binding domain-containing protein, partial [Bacteroidota bacterium]